MKENKKFHQSGKRIVTLLMVCLLGAACLTGCSLFDKADASEPTASQSQTTDTDNNTVDNGTADNGTADNGTADNGTADDGAVQEVFPKN